MKLASVDETDLLIPLHAGVHDRALWRTFLARVLRRTGADHAALIFAEGEQVARPILEVSAGRDLADEANALGLAEGLRQLRRSYTKLRTGRVYHAAELLFTDPAMQEARESFRRSLGLSDERVLRIAEQEGVNAWVVLTRRRGGFSAADGALLAALAPHVTVAVRGFVLLERQRLRAALAAATLGKAGAGWIAFRHDGRLLDIDPGLGTALAAMLGVDAASLEGVVLGSPPTRQAIVEASRDFARHAAPEPRVATLSREPRIEALLIPADLAHASALNAPAVLALLRLPRGASQNRRHLLARLFGLSEREAELAALLSDGASIGEAAERMGVKEETARGYSKQIYAKTDARGQSELIRLILNSVAVLA